MAKEDDQIPLFDSDPEWEEHWKGMPEFVQQDLEPIKQITVSFETPEDMQKFAELVGQPITMNTRSIWYPEAEIGRYANKRYAADEVADPAPATAAVETT